MPKTETILADVVGHVRSTFKVKGDLEMFELDETPDTRVFRVKQVGTKKEYEVTVVDGKIKEAKKIG